jgi:hypothetical protein
MRTPEPSHTAVLADRVAALAGKPRSGGANPSGRRGLYRRLISGSIARRAVAARRARERRLVCSWPGCFRRLCPGNRKGVCPQHLAMVPWHG